MVVVLDKIFNGEYQYQVVGPGKVVVASGFKEYNDAMRYIVRNK